MAKTLLDLNPHLKKWNVKGKTKTDTKPVIKPRGRPKKNDQIKTK
jgi:hypothetical protein